jgi:hypothetical protein
MNLASWSLETAGGGGRDGISRSWKTKTGVLERASERSRNDPSKNGGDDQKPPATDTAIPDEPLEVFFLTLYLTRQTLYRTFIL